MENYYFVRRKSDQAYPLLCITERDNEFNPTLINLEFNGTIPKNPVMADFLSGPELFFTEKVCEVIKSFALSYVRFIATELTTPKGACIEDYFCMQVDNDIEAMDKEESDFEFEHDAYWIEEMVLDRESLNIIPLNERLVFVLQESPDMVLFHETVKDAIMKVHPTGMEFVNIEEAGVF
ncbi:imm11 family protein [Apibacter sp. HY039]|uniref:imm11 family protein n=1 Tax=Apibacter sp. HY039 TaxID=2501476 RepID=UPI000FEB65F2|nr:DUF1629 domain-containing protein [Apibacter sp. HY039]